MSGQLIVVCGPPGVGKSKVAAHIEHRTGGRCFRTDEIRKEMFGPEPDYTQEESQAVYDELLSRAKQFLIKDRIVILDGTFMKQSGRQRASNLAQRYTDGYQFTLIRVTADEDVVEERIRNRDGVSDADVEVYRSIRDRFEDIRLPHKVLDNSGYWWDTSKTLDKELDVYATPSWLS
jgi:predicted kinase